MSAQPTGVRKPDRCQVRISGLTSVVGPPRGGREGIAAGSEATEAVRKAEASLWNLDAKRTTDTVLPAWSPKQSFTAGVKPDGNVCRAELNLQL